MGEGVLADLEDLRVGVHRGEVPFLHVGDEDSGLVGKEKEAADDELLIGGQRQAEGVGGLAGVEVSAKLLQQVRFEQGVFVAALDVARDFLQPFLDRLQVGQHQLGGHNPDVPLGVNVPGNMDNIRILKAAHDLDHRVHLTDVAEELVAEPLPVRCALDQARNVHKPEGGRNLGADLDHLGELGQTWVRHTDDAQVGLDGAERVILRRGLVRAGDGVEER